MLRRIARFCDERHFFAPLALWTPYYERLDKSPGVLVWFVAWIFWVFKGKGVSKSQLRRRVEALRLPTCALRDDGELPSIEILVVCAEKDFMFLPHVIESAIDNSKNPIEGVTVITPKRALLAADDAIAVLDSKVPLNLLPEEDFISSSLLSGLKSSFGSRAGWVLQQYLTIEFVFRSQASGVLVVDADTFCLAPTTWLLSDGSQPLHVSSEYVHEYYTFLNRFSLSEVEPKYTHVTHHMLMQPLKAREIFKFSGIANPSKLLENLIVVANTEGQTMFCIEFELYAQGMYRMYPTKVCYQKFGNRSVSVSSISEALAVVSRLNARKEPIFSSVSFHSYARSIQESDATTQ